MTEAQRDSLLVTLRTGARALVTNRQSLRAALLGGRREEACRLMDSQRVLAERMLMACSRCDAPDEITGPLMAMLEADERQAH